MDINAIDILLLLVFLAVVGFGFMGGTIRLLLILVSLYLGVVVAGFFYLPAATWMATHVDSMETYTAHIVAFFLLLAFTTTIVSITLIKTVSLRLPNVIASLDQVGGAALGALTATFAVVIVSVVFKSFSSVVTASASIGLDIWPGLLALAHQMNTSALTQLFLELSAPIFLFIVPWFPSGLPEILVLH